MHGTPTIPFTTLFADTVRKHGRRFAFDHYVATRRPGALKAWEFNFFLRSTGLTSYPMVV